MAVTAPRVNCRFCPGAGPVSDPGIEEFYETCDACLHQRTDDAIWHEGYALLAGLWMTRRYALLRGELPRKELNDAINEQIRNIWRDPANVPQEGA
jgi:hypothetical protein